MTKSDQSLINQQGYMEQVRPTNLIILMKKLEKRMMPKK